MDIVIGMALCAVLFVVFTLLFPKRKCSEKCGACHGVCEFADRSDRDVF
jgi:hypothetical protein